MMEHAGGYFFTIKQKHIKAQTSTQNHHGKHKQKILSLFTTAPKGLVYSYEHP